MDNTKPSQSILKDQASREYLYIRKNEKLNNLVGMLQKQNNTLLHENLKLISTVSELKEFTDELKEQMLNLTEERQTTHLECRKQQQSLIATINQLKKVIAELDQEKAGLEGSLSKIFYSDSEENSFTHDFEVKYKDLECLYEERFNKWEQEKLNYQQIIDKLQQDLTQIVSSKLELEQNYKLCQESILQLNQTLSEFRHSNIPLDSSNYSINQTYLTEEHDSNLFDMSFSNTSLNQSHFEFTNDQIKKKVLKELRMANRHQIRSKLNTSLRNAYKLPNNLTEIVKRS